MNQLSANTRSTKLFFKHIIRKVFLEDWTLKLSAALITFAIWFGVSYSSKKGTATFDDAQLNFRPSDTSVVTNASLQKVTLRVAGDDREIDRLYGPKMQVTVDLTELEPGDHTLQLTPDNVSIALPPGVRLEDIQPSRIAVSLEAKLKKELPVKAEITGQPAPGFEIYTTTVTPAKVVVTGQESYISTLDHISSGSVDVGGAKSDVVAHQQPVTIPSNKILFVTDAVVDVAVRIGEKRVERAFALTTSTGKHVTAVLFGPRSLLTKAKPTDLKVDIVKGDNGGDTPQLTLPDALQGVVEIRTLSAANK
jgi:hypothetical protein